MHLRMLKVLRTTIQGLADSLAGFCKMRALGETQTKRKQSVVLPSGQILSCCMKSLDQHSECTNLLRRYRLA